MTGYYLGADVGSSKTHVLIADEEGQVVGFGRSGAGNHETVGYDGLERALQVATAEALTMAGLSKDDIAGAGFGVAGFDWPSEREATLRAIATLGLSAPVDAVNDALIGLLAGSAEGWGIAVVSGTGCNCRGWDRSRSRQGVVTGASFVMGEAAGASELVGQAIRHIAHAWTRRGPATRLTAALVEYAGVQSAAELLEGITSDRIRIGGAAAPLVFQVAAQGDPVANDLIRWAGRELGSLAVGVIRQLEFEDQTFDLILAGSLFDGSPMLAGALAETVQLIAPGGRIIRLHAPPVIGAVVLGMEQAQFNPASVRPTLIESARSVLAQAKGNATRG